MRLRGNEPEDLRGLAPEDSDAESDASLSESAKRKRGVRGAKPKKSTEDIALGRVQGHLANDERQVKALATAAGLVRQSTAKREAALEDLNAAAGGRLGKNPSKSRLHLHLLGVELSAKEEAFVEKLQNPDDQMEGGEEQMSLMDLQDQLEEGADPKSNIEYVLVGEAQDGERKGKVTITVAFKEDSETVRNMLWDKNMSPLSLKPEESLDALLPKEVITGTPRTKTSAWARLRQMGLPFGKGCYVPPQDEGVVTLTLRLYAKLAGEEAVKNALDQECEKGHIASVIGVRKLPREKTPPEEWRRLSQEQQGKRKARRTFVALVTPTDKNLDASKVPKVLHLTVSRKREQEARLITVYSPSWQCTSCKLWAEGIPVLKKDSYKVARGHVQEHHGECAKQKLKWKGIAKERGAFAHLMDDGGDAAEIPSDA